MCKQVLSTNLMSNFSQDHEAEACQSEHQEFFLTVTHTKKINQPNQSRKSTIKYFSIKQSQWYTIIFFS